MKKSLPVLLIAVSVGLMTTPASAPVLSMDFNTDGGVDMADFAVFSTYWALNDCDRLNDWCNGFDMDQDGQVYLTELLLFVDQWLLLDFP